MQLLSASPAPKRRLTSRSTYCVHSGFSVCSRRVPTTASVSETVSIPLTDGSLGSAGRRRPGPRGKERGQAWGRAKTLVQAAEAGRQKTLTPHRLQPLMTPNSPIILAIKPCVCTMLCLEFLQLSVCLPPYSLPRHLGILMTLVFYDGLTVSFLLNSAGDCSLSCLK